MDRISTRVNDIFKKLDDIQDDIQKYALQIESMRRESEINQLKQLLKQKENSND